MRHIWLQALLVLAVSAAHAAVKMEPVAYKQGNTTLRGQIAYDDAIHVKRPGILVVHEWWGLNDYAEMRARDLAKAGYVAFALDMYGDGKHTDHPDEAGAWAAAVSQNQKEGEARFMAAYDLLKKDSRVDPDHIAAIGYCFGGGVVLHMALVGCDLDGVVSFHGSLPQEPARGKVVAHILVCHGAADGFTPPDKVLNFQKNLTDAGADWEFISYGGAKHSFTNPNADKTGVAGLAYNEKADHRSWQTMLDFLHEVCQ
jgi:dienelactone hydrolase